METGTHKFDLEERTLKFAMEVRDFSRLVPRDLTNIEYIKQLVRSSASVGANYIEANESLSKKDFLMRMKISRKEAKESSYWLSLITVTSQELSKTKHRLSEEAIELTKIFTSICRKSQ